MRQHPTYTELGKLLMRTSPLEYGHLLTILGIRDFAVDDNRPSTYRLMQVLAYDWMNAIGLLDVIQRQAIVMSLADHFGSVALEFDVYDIQFAAGLAVRPGKPQAMLAVNDYRYARLIPHPAGLPVFYDAVDGVMGTERPEPSLTVVSCDLRVLIERTLGRMKWLVKPPQESTDAPATTTPDGRVEPSGDPPDVGSPPADA